MGRLTLKTKVALLFSLFSTAIIIFTGVFFSAIYYYVVEKDVKTYLVNKSSELASEFIAYDSFGIYLKPGQQGETLSSRLRIYDLSAVVLDDKFNQIIDYGVYRNISKDVRNKITDTRLLNPVINTGLPLFSRTDLFPGTQYDIYTVSLAVSDKKYGVFQIAKEASSVNRILQLNIYILVMILPISILLSWLAGYFVTKKTFSPLANLISHMQTIQSHEQAKKIDIKRLQEDEITELAHAFNNMLERIGEGIEKQKEFISNASHELKTPLTHAISSLEISILDLKDNSPEEAEREIKLVTKDLLELNNVLDGLLTMSKITDDKNLVAIKNKIEILPFIKGVLNVFSKVINQNKIKIINNVPGKIFVFYVPEYLNIILSNIISNALKYSRKNGEVLITAVTEDEKVKITVKDSGAGMDKKTLKHLFERFFRGDKTKADGSGLGMAIVKTICDKSGLKINIVSTPGQGTIVEISGLELI